MPSKVDTETQDLTVGEVYLGDPPNPNRRTVGLAVAAVAALSLSTWPGLGVVLALGSLLLGVAWAAGFRTGPAKWCLATMLLLPWLVIRDNTWLAISIVCTVFLSAALATDAAATKQRMTDLSVGAIFRLGPRPASAPSTQGTDHSSAAVLRGLLFAAPVVGVFWLLLASADDVFASVFNPDSIPTLRIVFFVVLAPICVGVVAFAATARNPRFKTPSTFAARFFGPVESSIVLGAVSALFAAFITLRLATLDRDIEDVAWRSEVRSGFFQLLWVAALTVLLVLAIRQVAGPSGISPRVRILGWLAIALASVIDGLAVMRIAEYVELSFLSPLRFWSFGFGLWLLVILGFTSLRLSGWAGGKRWFTAAALGSWMLFLSVLGVINPDHRIAQHNFDSYDPTAESLTPDGEPVWIAVKPLMWLSEDATDVIVENIEVLRPMPNDRYVRVRDHLCTRELPESWRDWNISRSAARDAIQELC